jgi:hypothetical protein
VDNDNFKEEIASKLYLKYVYKTVKKDLKTAEKETFSVAINRSSSIYLYEENPLKKYSFYFIFCEKKSPKSRKSSNPLF